MTCVTETCDRPAIARGLCTKHYQRVRKDELRAAGRFPSKPKRSPEELVQHRAECRERRLADPERYREIGRRSYHKHREANLARAAAYREVRRDEINERKRARYAQLSLDEKWERWLKKTWGLTKDDYAGMLARQGGVCAICRQPERPGSDGRLVRLSVDHCHTTGAIRGLLCRTYNTAVGLYENAVLKLCIREYLEASA